MSQEIYRVTMQKYSLTQWKTQILFAEVGSVDPPESELEVTYIGPYKGFEFAWKQTLGYVKIYGNVTNDNFQNT